MKQALITILRNRQTTMTQYRQAANQLGTILAIESANVVPKTDVKIDTPLASAKGERFSHQPILISILRSGLVLLPPFLQFYPESPVGFIGIRRDEKTFVPELYYSKLFAFEPEHTILLLDPMIATGNTCTLAIQMLKDAGAQESQITLIAFIAAPEGLSHLKKEHPKVGCIVAQIDEKLDKNKWILPGLGDFGDRYFGIPPTL